MGGVVSLPHPLLGDSSPHSHGRVEGQSPRASGRPVRGQDLRKAESLTFPWQGWRCVPAVSVDHRALHAPTGQPRPCPPFTWQAPSIELANVQIAAPQNSPQLSLTTKLGGLRDERWDGNVSRRRFGDSE